MRITRRRKRRLDPFTSQAWVRSIFTKLTAAFPMISSLKEKDLVKLARAVRHVTRYSATDTRRGRPSRWPREYLVKIASKLAETLDRETSGRISIITFVDHYLRLLDFSDDVLESLAKGEVNLFEAEQLSRVKAGRLAMSHTEARRKRAELLSSHLGSRSSGERLRRRVNEMLATPSLPASSVGTAVEVLEDLEDFDPYDSTHLFWEEIKQLGFAFREIRREDLDEGLLEELLKVVEPVWSVLRKIKNNRHASQNRS